ncbi:MAG: type II secretion system F family protein [Actinomycetota bacterium]
MSSLYVIALLTFGAVISTWWTVSSPSGRKRAVELLESQVSAVAGPTPGRGADGKSSRSLLERAFLPLLRRTETLARRITPGDMRARVAHKLALAGSPGNWDADKMIAVRLLGGVGAPLAILMLSLSGGGTSTLVLVALSAFVGAQGPDMWLSRKAQSRQAEIRASLPDTIDLLTISVEAGLGFDAALSQVVHKVAGELSAEITRTMQEMQVGASRAEAFRNLAARSDVEELKSFVIALTQADAFGISASKVLRAQSKEMRTKRRQRAEEQAMKLPVKLLFPLIFCVLPTLFIVILGPGIIRMIASFTQL